MSNWSPILSGALAGLIVTLVGYALMRSRPKVDAQSGRSVASYSSFVRTFGIALTLMLALGTAYTVWTQPDDRDVHWFLGAFTVLGGGCLLLEFFGVRIEFDSESIQRFAPWHRPRIAAWSEVERVTYSSWASWHVLHTASGKIRVPDWISGAGELVAYARRRAEANNSNRPKSART